MANHFFSINRGVEGFKKDDITRATSSTTGDDVELRVADAASLTRLDVVKACDAFKRLFEAGGADPAGTTFPSL